MQHYSELDRLREEIRNLKNENEMLKETKGNNLSISDLNFEILKRQKDIEKLEKRIRSKKYNIKKLESEVQTDKNTISNLLNEIKFYKNKIDTFNKENFNDKMDIT